MFKLALKSLDDAIASTVKPQMIHWLTIPADYLFASSTELFYHETRESSNFTINLFI
ncbi:hypothetical protein FC90_GL000545 [Latilactobacillus graminis DSM 20719]|uniref:Uncharacterized protein n=1 Tax=Latilactobacillus graminis DSM 20719 TaxID=1423752 RepID=A0AA89I3U2_9LACO|nr:hypothetical protein FC90_GL000545 [Latilactobacillus graminis DSM 20719]